MAEPTQVQRLAAFAAACRDEGLPEAVSADVGGRILDVLGNCLAGRAESQGAAGIAEPDRAVLRAVAAWGGTPEAGVIGSHERLPAPERGAGQRHPRARPGLRRHPPAVRAPPQRLDRAGRTGRGRGRRRHRPPS